MDTRRELVRLVQRADSDKADHLTCLVVVAPQCHLTLGAAGNFLALATVGGRVNNLDVPLEQLDTVGLHECVKGKGGSGFSLASATVATVDNQWPCDTAITHEAAGTAAVECGDLSAHFDDSPFFGNLTFELSPAATRQLE